MGEFGRYQSRLAQRALAERVKAGDEARALHFQAAALFVDVSGYTDLVHDAAVSGLERVEDLGTSLNAYFSGLIDAVASRGGDVVGFAGDAMLALFVAAEPGLLPQAARRAAAAAMAVREALVVMSSPSSQVSTYARSRIMLACGPAWSIAFGRPGRVQHVLVAGAAIERLAAGPGAGPAGMLAVHASVCQALGSAARLAPIAGIDPQLAQELRSLFDEGEAIVADAMLEHRLADDVLLSSLPFAITEGITNYQTRWLTEMRFVCPIFARIDAIGDAQPGQPDAIASAVLAIEDVLRPHGGELRQVRAEGRGVVVVAIFGTPGHTHEDDPLRAALAACAMRTALSGSGFAISIGVSAGKGLCGLYGNATRAEFMVLGDAMNLAARLMQRGQGTLADQASARLAGPRLRWVDAGRFHPKGFPEAIDIASLEGSRAPRTAGDSELPAAGATPTVRLFGRAAERAQIDDCLRSHRQATMVADDRALLIEGDAGMGKTALARYAAEHASQLLIPTMRVAGNRIESLTPYYIWRGVLRELAAGGAGLEARSAEDAITAALAESSELREFAPLLGNILPLAFEQSELTRQMDATARADMTARLLVHCVQALVRGPTVFVFEDAHWIDSASWSVIARLPQSADRVFLIVTMRPLTEAANAATVEILEKMRLCRLVLAGLSHGETAGVVAARLGARGTAPDVAAFIGERCAGNPFFAEELALAMHERGDLGLDAGVCTARAQLDNFALLGLPETVRAAILERLDRLSERQKLILKIASVVGAVAGMALLEHLLEDGPREAELIADIVAIEGRQLADLRERAGEREVCFRHAIIQEVAYQLLTPSQTRRLHGRIAEWHENKHAAQLDPWLPLLAHHFGASDEPVRAFPYLVSAGEKALHAHANAEAVHFLSASLAIRLPHREDLVARARRRGMLAEAYLKLSDLSACREQLSRALRLVESPSSGGRLELALRFAAAIFTESLPKAARRRLAQGRSAEIALLRAQLHQLLAEAAYFQHETLTLLNGTFAGLREARRFGISVELAKALATSAVVTGLMRFHAVSRRHLAEAQATAAAAAHAPTIAYVEQLAGVCASSAGDWRTARLKVSLAADGYLRVGDAFRWRSTRMLLAYNALHQGDFDSIEGLLASADELAVFPSGPLQLRIWFRTAQLARANALAARSLAPLTGAELIDEVRLLAQSADASQAPLCRGFVADALRLRRESGGAAEQAQLGLAVLRQHRPTTYFSLFGIVSIGETFAALAAHDRDRRDDLIEDALRVQRILDRFAVSVPIARPSARLLDGRIRALRGDRRGAGKSMEAAAVLAGDLGMEGVRSAALRAIAGLEAARQPVNEVLGWS